MTSIDTAATTIQRPDPDFAVDPAHLAAASFLACDSGRTLDAHRHDLRGDFNWAVSVGLVEIEATRPISSCTDAGWRSKDWRRRLSTGACRRCAASTVLLTSMVGWRRTRPSTSADPRFTPRRVAGCTVPNSVGSSSRRSATTTTTPRWRSCSVERPASLRSLFHQK